MGLLCCKDSQINSENEFKPEENKEKYNENIIKDKSLPGYGGFELQIQWSYFLGNKRFDIVSDKVQLNLNECKFNGSGNDEHGDFNFNAVIDKDGEVMIKSVYEDGLYIKFCGKFEENIIRGNWEDKDNNEGTFTLELISQVWNSDTNFIALKSLNEMIGVGQFNYGFGMLTGTATGESDVHLNVTFADGKKGTFDFSLAEDSIKGKLKSPEGEEELILMAKNEFA